jgi:hypothetical protein
LSILQICLTLPLLSNSSPCLLSKQQSLLASKQSLLAEQAAVLLANQNKAGKQSCPFLGKAKLLAWCASNLFFSILHTLFEACLACLHTKQAILLFRHNPARPLPSTLTIYYFLWQAEKKSHHE